MKSPRNWEERSSFQTANKNNKDDHAHNSNRWVTQLLKSVQNVAKKNKLKYDEILEHNSHFAMELHQSQYETTDGDTCDVNIKILEIQLDSLLEEENKLNQELNKMHIKKQQNEQLKELQVESKTDYYSVLRSLWRTSPSETAEDRIQRLSENVGSIKGHIKSLLEQQTKMKGIHFSQTVFSSTQYYDLRDKYEQLLIQSDDTKANLQHIIEKNKRQLAHLRQQNKMLKQLLSKEKAITSQQEISISDLNSQLNEINTTLLKKQSQKLDQFLYQGKQNLTISISVRQKLQQHEFETNRKFQEIHTFLTTKNKTKTMLEKQSKYMPPRIPIRCGLSGKKPRPITQIKSADQKRSKVGRTDEVKRQQKK